MNMGQIKFFSVKLGMNTIKPVLCVLEKTENIPTFGREWGGSLGLALSQLYISQLGLRGGGVGKLGKISQIKLFFFILTASLI